MSWIHRALEGISPIFLGSYYVRVISAPSARKPSPPRQSQLVYRKRSRRVTGLITADSDVPTVPAEWSLAGSWPENASYEVSPAVHFPPDGTLPDSPDPNETPRNRCASARIPSLPAPLPVPTRSQAGIMTLSYVAAVVSNNFGQAVDRRRGTSVLELATEEKQRAEQEEQRRAAEEQNCDLMPSASSTVSKSNPAVVSGRFMPNPWRELPYEALFVLAQEAHPRFWEFPTIWLSV